MYTNTTHKQVESQNTQQKNDSLTTTTTHQETSQTSHNQPETTTPTNSETIADSLSEDNILKNQFGELF